MRKGFTMIELIFVIVILGILAAVAIPRLTATRDDANIAKASTEIATLVNDIGAYYTSQGKFDTLDKMSNVKLSSTNNKFTNFGVTALTTKGYYTDLTDTTAAVGCIGFQVSATDGNLTISSESNTSATCKGINAAVANLVKVHQFGGSSVKY
ncbi:MAG: prepilin-type N-terminal cleavage/methylation domain-containing protein [Sulfurospirillum cavolei]|nr:prepilin-type N-terminal cleavage/methylation domain-containing protein [Sulfurospirillum cavolei]